MSRLASAAKAGYYPIHPTVTAAIANWLDAPHGGRLYDPCCGEGAALAQLADALDLAPYGNELHNDRAMQARQAIAACKPTLLHRDQQTQLFWSSVQTMEWSRAAFNLLYLNPPYDHDEDNGRLELNFLKMSRLSLCPDGILVFVLPQRILGRRDVAQYLASRFHTVRVLAHPDAQRAFNEVTVLGVHNKRSVQSDPSVVEHLVAIGRGTTALDVMGATQPIPYSVPKLSNANFLFRPQRLTIDEIMAEVAKRGVMQSREWRQQVSPAFAKRPSFQPLTALRRGHLVNLIAAGMLNNEMLEHENGELLYIKGQTYKKKIKHTYREYDSDEDGGFTEVTTETERFETRIVTIDPAGCIERRDGEALSHFLQKWIQPLTNAVVTQHQPVYQFDLGEYRDVLNSLNQERSIPNTNGLRGLLPAQQHAAAAAATRLDPRQLNAKDAIIVGEMGVGKSLLGPAVATLIGAGRILVMCPPHLVAKWEREIGHVNPAARTMPLKTISDVDAFFATDTSRDAPLYGVMKETSARSGSGWQHAYQWCGGARHKNKTAVTYESALVRAVQTSKWEADDKVVDITIAGRSHRIMIRQLLAYIRQHRHIRSASTGDVLLTANGTQMDPRAFGAKQRFRRYATRRGRLGYDPLYHYTRRYSKGKRGPTMRETLARHDKLGANLQAGHSAYSPLAPHPMTPIQPGGYAKWPLATYILKRYKGQIDLLCVDEVHEMKAADSDRGYAFGRLVAASKKVLGLSGTIYGGKASTLFSLLYRMSQQMKQRYAHNDTARWVSEYGVLQEIERVRFDESGKQTGNKRSNVSIKELPGASPAMMRWLLDRAVFVNLADMGFALPEYEEEPLLIDMSPAMKQQYDALQSKLKDELRDMLIRNDRSLLAAYLQSLLSWPDSPWRGKTVRHPRTERLIAHIPGLPNLPVGVAPKEAAIVQKIQAEVAAGRNVLLLCQQTNTLDITPQWKQLLESKGIKTAVLTVEPKRREAWIDRQAELGTQVIISHPRRVQTGLDLLDYPTILWMAIDYSVYTVKQASRRSFRIGQTEDVFVGFHAYRGTLQEQALKLVAAKMAATDRIDGNTVSTDSLTELDEIVGGDLITTLAKIVIGEESLSAPDLAQSFAVANSQMQESLSYIGVEMPAETQQGIDPTYSDIGVPNEQLIFVGQTLIEQDLEMDVFKGFDAQPASKPSSLFELLMGAGV